MKRIILLLMVCLIFSCSSSKTVNMESVLYPEDRSIQTDTFIIQSHNKKYFEKYTNGYNENSKHLSWSLAKIVTALLIGRAEKLGYLKIEDKLQKYIPSFRGDATIVDLLQMSSGIDFKERYVITPINEDVTKFLYLEGPNKGSKSYILDLPISKDQPGSYFSYNSGTTNLLLVLLKEVLPAGESYNNWPWKSLFNVLDIQATFEQDSKGFFIGSAYLYMRAQDYMKFAQLIMNEGKWGKVQLISKEFIQRFYQLAPGVGKKVLKGSSSEEAYTFHAISNLPIKERSNQSQYPNLPLDSLFAIGFQGQFLIFSKKNQMIILRLSNDKGSSFKKDQLFQEMNKYLKSKQAQVTSSNDELGRDDKYIEVEEKAIWNLRNLHKLPLLIKSYAAKSICSCVFVLERKLDRCKEDLKNGLPFIPGIKVDWVSKEVSTSLFFGLWNRRAKYRNEKLGCYLPSL